MAKLNIDTGALGNPATGDTLRTAMTKINTNFTELYDSELLSLSQGLIKTVTTNGDIKIQPNGTGQVEIDQLLITSDSITSLVTNGDVTLAGNGTGNVIVEAITVNGTTLSSADSTLITVAEALEVTGAATLGTSLALASGATVTGIDNGALGTSATLLATQGAIKTYVDSQVTVQDLDVASDSGTAAVDLDSQSLTVTGGTGIGTTATGQAVTVNIDATVATLVGSQTLENKTLTTPVITEIDSGADITLDATNDVNIPADVGLTFGDDGEKIEGDGTNLLISSSGLATITATGNTVITNNALVSGNLTVSGNLDVTGTLDLSDSNFTNVGSLQLDSIAGDGDTNTSITFSGSDVITIATGGAGRLTIGDGALTPVTDNQIDLGTSSLEFKDAYFDGTVTSDAFAGPLTGAVTGNADTATTSTNVTVADESSDTTCFPLFTTAASGDLPPKSGTNLTFNSSSGVLTATGFIGALTGTASIASAVVVADESSDTTCFPLFASGATSGQAVKSGSNLTFNSSTGIITATGFAGALTGNVTGNTSGTAATVTGAAQTNITSLGTLTTLTVDDIIINGSTIGRTDDTDLLTLASDALTVAGTISLTGGQVVPGIFAGTNFSESLLLGHSTTGTLNNAERNTGVGFEVFKSLTSGTNNVAVGIDALEDLTTGAGNTVIGSGAGANITGTPDNTIIGSNSFRGSSPDANSGYNTVVGANAMNVASGAAFNTAIGRDAGREVSTGDRNTFLGYNAGANDSSAGITSGSGNVIIGTVDPVSRTGDRQLVIAGNDGTTTTTWISGNSAGLLTITGGEVIPGKQGGTNFTDSLLVGHSTTGTLNDAQNNVGVGIGTLDSITSGDNNVAIGKNALTALTTSSNNVAVGLSAAQFLSTSAGGNTAFGNSSLYYNQTGTDNVAIGNSALQGASGQSSSGGVAIGASALEGVTTGANNIGIGKSAGDNITSGAGNVIIGSINADSATADKQLIIADGVDGSVAWLKGDSAGDLTFGAGITVGGSFQQAVHTFVATDAITVIEHAGRILLLGEVGGNADVVLTLPDATGSGNVYEFIVSVTMASNTYKIACPDADNTITGTIQYLDLDGNAVSAFGTVAASDTITLNGGTQGGQVGDTLTLIDLVANKWMVKGQMRVPAGANPATPFSAAVS